MPVDVPMLQGSTLRNHTRRPAMRLMPLTLVLVFFAVALGWRSWLHRRRYGSWGIMLGRRDAAAGRLVHAATVALPVVLLGDALWTTWRPSAAPSPLLTLAGAAIVVVALLL